MGFSWNGTHASDLGIVLRDHPAGLLPATREAAITVPGRHGTLHQRTEFGERSLSLDLLVEADTLAGVHATIRQLAAMVDPTTGTADLIFDHQPDRVWKVKVSGTPEVDPGWDWFAVELPLTMPMPFVVAADDTTVALDDVTTGADPRPVVNAGTASSPLTVTVEPAAPTAEPATPAAGLGHGYVEAGPLVDPQVTVGGVAFRWLGTVPLGSKLVVDCDAMTVTLDGADALSGWDVNTGWPDAPPGEFGVEFSDGVGSSADVTLAWRERYL